MSLNSILVLLFVAIISTSVAHDQTIVGLTVNVNGTLYCSPNGRSRINPTPVFPNTLIEVVCAEGVVGLNPSNATTDAAGYYRIYVLTRYNSTLESIISNCRVFVPAPLSSCNPALPASGLVSNLQFVRTVQYSFLRTTYMVPAGFTTHA